MKEEILKRAMFAMPLSKSAKNSGIMEGFEEDENADLDEMPPMSRTPQNPEILMNTLRGDMRSVDARYMELAQMVGEEAAYETPPEVLAMLQSQLSQQQQPQQGGIGGLPQAAEMQPPPMGGPEAGGAPPMPGAAPQGMPPEAGMPPGGGGIAPFSQGGADQAPPTPDGLPPARAALGGLQTLASRFSQMASPAASQLNTYLGRMFMSPQPTLQRMTVDGYPLTVQAREALVAGPGGTIAQGVGTRLAPYTTLGGYQSPTLTEGLTMGMQRLAAENPRIAAAVSRYGPASLGTVLGVEGARRYSSGETAPVSQERQNLLDTYKQLYERLQGGPGVPMPFLGDRTNEQLMQDIAALEAAAAKQPAAPAAAGRPPQGPSVQPPMAAGSRPMAGAEQDQFMMANAPVGLSSEPLPPEAFRGVASAPAPAGASILDRVGSRPERIRAEYKELAPLYKEILGDDKDTAKTNALLLLADAGFKLAGSRQPTFAMGLAEAAGGLPRGFAAIAAQTQEQEGRIKASALSQAINDVADQDRQAAALRMEILKGDFRILLEQAKKAGTATTLTKDGGMGLRVLETKEGSFLGASVDPNDPTIKSAISSRFTLRDTDNPFVENRGQSPTTVETNKDERIKLGNTLRSLDNSLATLDNLKGTFAQLYSPGTWFQDKVNNLLVPVSGGVIRPDVNQVDAATRVQTGLNTIMKNIASANDSGRVAVQEQEWARETAKGISDPTKFFANKEIAAKQFGSLESVLRNARQQVLTQLGYEGNDYVMRAPNTGTQTDPFVIPADPNQQRIMFNFLSSTIGKLQDPQAMVYIRMPNGQVSQFNPIQLRNLNRPQ